MFDGDNNLESQKERRSARVLRENCCVGGKKLKMYRSQGPTLKARHVLARSAVLPVFGFTCANAFVFTSITYICHAATYSQAAFVVPRRDRSLHLQRTISTMPQAVSRNGRTNRDSHPRPNEHTWPIRLLSQAQAAPSIPLSSFASPLHSHRRQGDYSLRRW